MAIIIIVVVDQSYCFSSIVLKHSNLAVDNSTGADQA